MAATGGDWEDAQRTLVEAAPAAASYELASWPARAAAYLIDVLVLGVVLVGAAVAFDGAPAGLGVWLLLEWAASWLYFGLLEARPSGQTLGKAALGIAVRAAGGEPAGTGKAFGRELLRIVFGIVPVLPLVDVLWPLWDRRNQALHDKGGGTIVVRVRSRG